MLTQHARIGALSQAWQYKAFLVLALQNLLRQITNYSHAQPEITYKNPTKIRLVTLPSILGPVECH